ncbi:hypothetical protein ARMGADRAFT_774551 [Armillaria gallica]|uniref:Uncharacterized protein n=1 Tax=Armillaria gallica TaxID=47427 RepID=A0A2H3CFE8_ARMGA|nr:hypothetical protein ARMGADRAFT_774551 [Armillaria gallica]
MGRKHERRYRSLQSSLALGSALKCHRIPPISTPQAPGLESQILRATAPASKFQGLAVRTKGDGREDNHGRVENARYRSILCARIQSSSCHIRVQGFRSLFLLQDYVSSSCMSGLGAGWRY